MPSLGSDMEEGTLLEWTVGPGYVVRRGQIVAVIDTDKAEIEVEAFSEGVVAELLAAPGETLPVGAPMLRFRSEEGAAQPVVVPAAAPPPAPVAAAASPAVSPRPAHAPGRVRVTPLARRRAEALGVDLATISGTGADGAITRADVEAAPGTAERPERDRGLSMRRAIAQAMARSKREIPHYYLAVRIDMKRALDWLQHHNEQRALAARLLPVAQLIKAVALAARQFPEMNGFWREGGFEPASSVHVGVGISLRGGGLVAPALHDVAERKLDDVMAGLRDLVARTRKGVLRSSEIADPTLTVTPLGDQGVEEVFGVIYPPQVCVVGFGAILERPWAVGGLLGVRPVVTASLAADHRASDGARGAKFLNAIDRNLQDPEAL